MSDTLPTQCQDGLDTHFITPKTVCRPSSHTETETKTKTKTETFAPRWLEGSALRPKERWALEWEALR